MRRFGMPRQTVRPFYLLRSEDVSGISATRVVAVGMVFPSGRVVLEWSSRRKTLSIFASLAEIRRIHGHGGKTRICLGIPDQNSMWRHDAEGETEERWWREIWQRWANSHPEGISLPPNGWGPWPPAGSPTGLNRTPDPSRTAREKSEIKIRDVGAESSASG